MLQSDKAPILAYREPLGINNLFPLRIIISTVYSSPTERFVINAVCSAGIVIGSILANAVTSVLLDYTHLWDLVFYIYTASSLFWYIFWSHFCSTKQPKPTKHAFINEEVRDKCMNALSDEVGKGKVPKNIGSPSCVGDGFWKRKLRRVIIHHRQYFTTIPVLHTPLQHKGQSFSQHNPIRNDF